MEILGLRIILAVQLLDTTSTKIDLTRLLNIGKFSVAGGVKVKSVVEKRRNTGWMKVEVTSS
jgi:hypothetical protein